MALGVYQALRKLNLRVPEDVAVVGFDNQELIAPDLDPGLTTMQLPHYEMGSWAVEHLLSLIAHPDQHQGEMPVQYVMNCPLVRRASV